MQAVLDGFLEGYNQRRPHQGRGMNGRTPAHAFTQGIRRREQANEDKTTARKPHRNTLPEPHHRSGTVTRLPSLYTRWGLPQ
jgi:hypothetical protein